MLPRALCRALARALVPACVALTIAATPAAASTADVAFPADGPLMQAALWAGEVYWGAKPCGGDYKAVWTDDLSNDTNAMSYWTTFSADPYGDPESNTDCRIEFNRGIAFDWPMLCSVAVHEMGHLMGHDHNSEPGHVMSDLYTAPLPGCIEAATRAGLIATSEAAAAPAPVAEPAPRRLTAAQRRARARRAARRRAQRAAQRRRVLRAVMTEARYS